MNRNRTAALSLALACGLIEEASQTNHGPLFAPPLERRNLKANSPIFNEMSGKLGGAVAMTTKFGIILRGNVTPSNPNTGPQTIVRNILSTISSYWRGTMTQDQRDGWTELAESSSGNGNGLTTYVKAMTEVLRAGGALVTAAPATIVSTLTTPTAIVIDDSANTLVFAFTDTDAWYANAGGLNVWCTTEQPGSRNTKLHPFIFLGTVSDPDTSPKSFSLATVARTVAGKVMYVRFIAWEPEGKVSTAYTQRITIVA